LNDKILLFRLFYSKGIGAFLTSNYLVCEYDTKIDNVDVSILQIPAMSSIITLAWSIGADIYVKKLDSAYFESLNKIKSVMQNWHPQLSFSTEIIAGDIISNRLSNDRYGLLYTGGIDSTTSYIKHRNKRPNLITVCGKGDDIEDYNKKAEKVLIDFSHQEGVRLNFIKTNVEQVIDRRLLFEKTGLNWWSSLSHGIVLSGLCAPLTCVENIGALLVASSFTREFNYPWGSHPLIENNIRWADIRVVHDGYEMTRQEKIRYILKEYIRKTGNYPILRVCTSRESREAIGAKCRCEKCCRSITGLVLEGIDPKKCGLNVDANTLNLIKESLINAKLFGRKALAERRGKVVIRIYPAYEWEDIQSHIPKIIDNDLYDSKKFFEWFRDFNIRRCVEHIKISQLPRLFLYSMFDLLAPIHCLFPRKIRHMIRWFLFLSGFYSLGPPKYALETSITDLNIHEQT